MSTSPTIYILHVRVDSKGNLPSKGVILRNLQEAMEDDCQQKNELPVHTKLLAVHHVKVGRGLPEPSPCQLSAEDEGEGYSNPHCLEGVVFSLLRGPFYREYKPTRSYRNAIV